MLGRAYAQRRCGFAPSTRPPGTTFCAQGEQPHTVYFVKAGLISLSMLAADGTELILMLRGPASLLCTEALRGEGSPYQVKALSRARVCALSGEEMKRWIASDTAAASAVLELVLEENRLQRIEASFREGDCLRRVARFALAYAGYLDGQPDALRKQVVARTLGMRPETLSRCLTRLERCGAINASHGMHVQYTSLLSAIASSDSIV